MDLGITEYTLVSTHHTEGYSAEQNKALRISSCDIYNLQYKLTSLISVIVERGRHWVP